MSRFFWTRWFAAGLIGLIVTVMLLWAATAHAQTLTDPVHVYMSADPVREDAIGLATPDGRYAVSKADNCSGAVGPGMNAILWQIEGFTGVGTLGTVDEQGVVHLLCNIRIERLMDPTPCFKNAEGACDIALEED